MAKSLFEKMGGKYERQGDYLIPCLTVSDEEEQAIGKVAECKNSVAFFLGVLIKVRICQKEF